MPLLIQKTFSVSFDDSPTWKVSPELLKTIDGVDFVKLRPWDMGFVKLVAHGVAEVNYKQKCSLAGTRGFKSLLQLRNDAVLSEEKLQDDDDIEDTGAAALFGDSVRPAKKARAGALRPRINAAKLQAMRDEPVAFDFEVPGIDNVPGLSITAIKPAHPCDDLCVKLDTDTLHHLVSFIRGHGFNGEDLLNKRTYRDSGVPGCWKMGSAGLVRLTTEEEKEKDDGVMGTKYRSVNKDLAK